MSESADDMKTWLGKQLEALRPEAGGLGFHGDKIVATTTIWRLVIGMGMAVMLLTPVGFFMVERRLDDRYDARAESRLVLHAQLFKRDLDERYDARYVRLEERNIERITDGRLQEQMEKNRQSQFDGVTGKISALDKKLDELRDSLAELRRNLKQ